MLGASRLSCSISVLSLLTKTSGFGVTFFDEVVLSLIQQLDWSANSP